MPVVNGWDRFDADDWRAFARAWFAGHDAIPPTGRVEAFARRLHATISPPAPTPSSASSSCS